MPMVVFFSDVSFHFLGSSKGLLALMLLMLCSVSTRSLFGYKLSYMIPSFSGKTQGEKSQTDLLKILRMSISQQTNKQKNTQIEYLRISEPRPRNFSLPFVSVADNNFIEIVLFVFLPFPEIKPSSFARSFYPFIRKFSAFC